MTKVISETYSPKAYTDVPIKRIPMGMDRNGNVAKWTSKNKEETIAQEIIDGLRCSVCTKEFTFEDDEEVIVPRPEYSSITAHKDCWEKTPKKIPDWRPTDKPKPNLIVPSSDGNAVVVLNGFIKIQERKKK